MPESGRLCRFPAHSCCSPGLTMPWADPAAIAIASSASATLLRLFYPLGRVHPALRFCTSSPATGGISKEDLRVEGKGLPSILHFVSRHRRDVEGRSSGSKDTLPFGPETSGSKERASCPAFRSLTPLKLVDRASCPVFRSLAPLESRKETPPAAHHSRPTCWLCHYVYVTVPRE